MRNLFGLDLLGQQAPQIPAQPQVGNAPVPGSAVDATGTGTPAAPVSFQRGQPVGFFTDTGLAGKCTSCYDLLEAVLVPACDKACPTPSIQVSPESDLQTRAEARLQQLQQAGHTSARLYGRNDAKLGGLNSFYFLEDDP